MRGRFLVLMALVTVLRVEAQGLIINQGESASFSFTTLEFFSTNTNLFSVARAGLGFVAPDLSAGKTVQMEFFTDSGLSGVPFFTQSITVPGGGIFFGSIAFETPSTAWDDLDGGMRVTMLNGNASVLQVVFDVNRPGERYFHVQQAVPEPGALALFGLGGTFLLFTYMCQSMNFIRMSNAQVVTKKSACP